jgi:membrane-associated phospholipid phosphatase
MALAISDRRARAAVERGGLRSVDVLLLGYLGVVSVVALARAERQPGCWWLLVAHGLFALLLLLVTRPDLGRVGRTLRELYPLLLLLGFYSELDVLNGMGTAPVHDAAVQRWELAVFGGQVSRTWWEAAPSAFWSAILHGAYLSYYLIVFAPAIYLTARGRLDALRHFVLAVMATFVLCYLVFLFFPVAGPYYVFPRPPEWFTDNGPARLAYWVLAAGSSYGAAFPSSHVAASVAAALAAAHFSRRLGLVLLLPTILLTIGVVYCQMHYGVDALAGVVIGGVVAGVVRRDLRVLSAGC